MSTSPCPLCSSGSDLFFQDTRRSYLRCSECQLVFVPPGFFVSATEERTEYDLHQNSPDDPGYRRFLSRVAEPIMARVPAPASGLDFGCGPGPTLSVMLTEHGYQMTNYDPLYFPDQAALDRTYDLVTATEVVEHLRDPRASLATLWKCVRPGGWLGIMTKRVIDRDAFSRWHYITDPTHVCFFSDQTMEWLSKRWGAAIEYVGSDVVLFQKSED